MPWTASLATNVSLIDEQHKELIARIESVLEALQRGGGNDKEIISTLDFLDAYVKKHFSNEEAMQIKCSYPTYIQHKALHTKYIQEIATLKERVVNEGITLNVVHNTHKILLDWFVNHINKVDKLFAEYYRNHKS